MINVIVCMKQVPDPEAPPSAFKVDTEAKKVVVGSGVPPVMNPFDENALEAALKIKDTVLAHITVICAGNNLSLPVLRRALAVGADDLILLQDNLFTNLDSFSTARILSAAIRKVGHFSIILTGRQASDTDAGMVGFGIAEILAIPVISLARKISIIDNRLIVEQVLSDGYHVSESNIPALMTVGGEMDSLRAATLKALLEAKKKPVLTWHINDIGFAQSDLKIPNIMKIFAPQPKGEVCKFITADSEEQAGINLAHELIQAKLY